MLIRAFQFGRILFYGAISTNQVVGVIRRSQPLQTGGLGKITVGKKVTIGYFPPALFFSTYGYIEARTSSASIYIGDGTIINNNVCIIAEHSTIKIGARCLIGPSVEILGSDFHSLAVESQRSSGAECSKPIRIGSDVFIGGNVKIMKGVDIGDGSVIANGAVVVSSIPAGVVAGGNPAKVIRKL